jgi:xylitol oxidase
MGFTPSAGNELQSEYLLPRGQAAAAIEALLERADTLRPLTQVSEIRTVAADRLWMSPAYEQDLVAVHFTWAPDLDRVSRALGDVEAALLPLGARPHWGKLFNARADVLAPRYPRLQDFRALLERLDPRGAFRNEWLGERLLGP